MSNKEFKQEAWLGKTKKKNKREVSWKAHKRETQDIIRRNQKNCK